MRQESELRPAQKRFAELAIRRPYVLLALDMGAGKTAVSLTAAQRLLDWFYVRRVLVVAPLRVANETWPTEIGEWQHLHTLDYAVATGSANQRKAAIESDARIVIINRENLRWMLKTYGRANWPKFDMLIYDEASRLKGGNMKSAKRKQISEFGSLCAVRHKFKRVVLLSGTPSPNGLIDLWGPSYVMDLGKRLGRTKDQFLSFFFRKDMSGFGYEPLHFSEKMIHELLADCMVSMNPQDYPDLPPVKYNNVVVKLPQKLIKEYKAFKRSLVSEAYDVEAVNRGVLTNKLLQFSNGSMYRQNEDDPTIREVVKIHDYKLDALESVVIEAAGRPVLVAYSFDFDKAAIAKKFGKKAVFLEDEPDFVRLWNKGKIKMGIVHPESAGHGLNLQYGGEIAVWYGLTHSLEAYLQFNKRLWRPGQTRPVFIHHIVCRDTDDRRVLDVLKDRNATQQRLMDAVRESVINDL